MSITLAYLNLAGSNILQPAEQVLRIFYGFCPAEVVTFSVPLVSNFIPLAGAPGTKLRTATG